MRAFLVFVAMVGLGAVVGAVVVGTRVFDGTVVDRPYERGLAWDEEQARRAASGLDVSIEGGPFRTGLNLVVVRIAGPDGGPVPDESVGIRLSRPETREHEKGYRAARREDGAFAASVALSLPGRWQATVIVERDGRSLEFPHELYAEGPAAEETAGGGGVGVVLCDIDAGPCVSRTEKGAAVSLEVLPRPVRTMANLVFTVRFDGEEGGAGAAPVVLHLDMPGMYMGENRVVLEPRGGGLYEGRGIIVRCPSGGRTWRARVEGPPRETVDFTFQVDG